LVSAENPPIGGAAGVGARRMRMSDAGTPGLARRCRLAAMKRLPVLAVILFVLLWPEAAALAQEFQPYPSPKITVEQWQKYLLEVRSLHEASADIYKDKNVVVFSDATTRTQYIFTTKDNPAHPAWITRQIVENGGKVSVKQIGYFAGAQEPFDKMFEDYLRLNDQLKHEVEQRNQ
jgi:hypothetical protein